MRKILLVSSVLAVAIVASCSKRSLEEVRPVETYENVIVTASVEQPECTRTSLDTDGLSLIWNEGDSFTAFGIGGEKSTFSLIGGAGTGEGDFSGSFVGEGPYILLYPHSEKSSFKDGCLNFELPSTQQYVASNIAGGSSPAVAQSNGSDQIAFRNLCGILRVSIKGCGQVLEKIVLQDLGGNMLWGNASLTIDGKQGTDEQTMTLTGGDNTITLEAKNISLNSTEAKNFYFVVPVGALDRGFTLAFHTTEGVIQGFVQTQLPNTAERSIMVQMPVAATSSYTEPAEEKARGFYKDLFMDGGISLTSRKTLPAAELLGLSMEHFASSSKNNSKDKAIQNQLIIGSDTDSNGVLLYPDGEPRFRLIYVNGGNSRNHGQSLYPDGLNNIASFVANGGSYTGSCAGSFLSSKGYDSNYPYIYYTSVWPGHTYHTKTDSGVQIEDAYTSLSVEPNCPLLKYYDLGERVDEVRHNGGSYINPSEVSTPAGTQVLMRYYTPGKDSTKLHGSVNAWAYKASTRTGRVVVSGSHPESVTSGKRLYYMASMLAYARDGVAPANIVSTSLGKNLSAVIGDLQYHHYKFSLGAKTDVVISLESEVDADLILTLRQGGKAYFTDAQYVLASSGSTKTLDIKQLDAGQWYIGVYCATTVTATKTTYVSSGEYTGEYYEYTGRTDVLNGVPYKLSVTMAN